eukprot:CAMPEP_0172450570 /NCGR_PEP_ID=MMETSP1065-20121228/8861_1 /TAXON_ID=265537 /ORGANISM="Amphiprora paludosa, Strain CCMP125" /LENGTH=113 /DNA_ID=CAMNT_0013202363 /DNA_START=87 /DNA_END=428 /DNA_ORIENTATION=+
MEKTCQDCMNTPLSDIYSVHMTIAKPWDCLTQDYNTTHIRYPKLLEFHREWHRVRHDLELSWGIAQSDVVESVDLRHYGHCANRPDAPKDKFTYGYEYIPIKFPNNGAAESKR